MAIAVPYQFDTTALPRKILIGFLAGCSAIVLVALAMLIKYGPLASLPVLLAAAFVAWVARQFVPIGLSGMAKGVIKADGVAIEPTALGRIRLPGPAGWYPLSQFKAVRVTYLGPNRNTAGYLFGRIDLVGHGGGVTFCVAYERDGVVKALAPEIAVVLGLPIEQIGLPPFN